MDDLSLAHSRYNCTYHIWLGHSDTSTTLNIYSHFNKKRLNETPDDLEELSGSCADLFH